MTGREGATEAREAQARALVAIAAMRAMRLAEGATEASLELVQRMAQTVCADRLAIDQVVGTTKSGRIIAEPGKQTETVKAWFTTVVKPIEIKEIT
mgnify:CR=1 FL=1